MTYFMLVARLFEALHSTMTTSPFFSKRKSSCESKRPVSIKNTLNSVEFFSASSGQESDLTL